MKSTIQFGVDHLMTNFDPLKFGKIGLVTNDAAFTSSGKRSRIALLEAGFEITKLFSPEHGISAKGADGAFMPNGTDLSTDLPIVSLYGEKLAPSTADLDEIDTVLFDVPDIGLRYYTYLWTLSYVLEECSRNQKRLVILDRPNPLSGVIEGPMLDEERCSSFIGRWDIPVRHGCTLGELAKLFNSEKQLKVDLQIIPCLNWQKNMFFSDWNLDFQPTSPAILSWECMLAYPVTAYLEATNLSDGRGSDTPFAQIGAPWLIDINLTRFLEITTAIEVEPCQFIPEEGKFRGELCLGIKLKVTNPSLYHPTLAGLCLIKTIREQYPKYFAWKPYPTRANPAGTRHLDLLLGVFEAEKLFDLPWDAFLSSVLDLTNTNKWQERVKPHLLY
ncbi:exo-beta-N-acetylmuramidase NamZ family protein [Flectobacillus roseus]|uniref:DUF1343 domain-containing protein n=1 Tax=Flectobacillus roseus TaxID=502259 RepID=A0ABT6Y8A6_9BACT|nr:DUF1343 domain-containing protein [Flectobacillus roseus]MDI9859761.1 DUF1343 domain-containing protein [Flectobacillus roseus]